MEDFLDKDQQKYLLELARKAIVYHKETGKTLKIDTKDETLNKKRGAFVTLKV
ncbi:MAG: AMMECR1 domain-containing protein, partial [Candidatus Aminicenantes bacterium]